MTIIKTNKMKKTFLAVAALLIGLTAAARPGGNISISNDTLLILKSANVTMTVDIQHGAKVISLKYNESEFLAQHVPAKGWFNNPNDFGSTFWPAPQSEWNWPPIATYDKNAYSIKLEKKAAVLSSGKDEKYPYIFHKTFKVGKAPGTFIIEYCIENAGDKPVSVAPWEITRVPGGGVMSFAAPKESVRPAEELKFEYADGIVSIPYVADPQGNHKIFADSKGWLSFEKDGLKLTKSFEDITTAEAAPGEDELEIYVNRGTTFIELENQGKYKTLQSGEKLVWTVEWKLEKK